MKKPTTEKEQEKQNDKSSSKSGSSMKYARVLAYLQMKNISEEQAMDTLTLTEKEPVKDMYRNLVTAARVISEAIEDKTLSDKDPFHSALINLLEKGDKITKSMTIAKTEAYPDAPAEEGTSLADRKR